MELPCSTPFGCLYTVMRRKSGVCRGEIQNMQHLVESCWRASGFRGSNTSYGPLSSGLLGLNCAVLNGLTYLGGFFKRRRLIVSS